MRSHGAICYRGQTLITEHKVSTWKGTKLGKSLVLVGIRPDLSFVNSVRKPKHWCEPFCAQGLTFALGSRLLYANL
jgi:hypothetical protein